MVGRRHDARPLRASGTLQVAWGPARSRGPRSSGTAVDRLADATQGVPRKSWSSSVVEACQRPPWWSGRPRVAAHRARPGPRGSRRRGPDGGRRDREASTYPLRSRVSSTLVMVPLVMCIWAPIVPGGIGAPCPSMTASALSAACDKPWRRATDATSASARPRPLRAPGRPGRTATTRRGTPSRMLRPRVVGRGGALTGTASAGLVAAGSAQASTAISIRGAPLTPGTAHGLT